MEGDKDLVRKLRIHQIAATAAAVALFAFQFWSERSSLKLQHFRIPIGTFVFLAWLGILVYIFRVIRPAEKQLKRSNSN